MVNIDNILEEVKRKFPADQPQSPLTPVESDIVVFIVAFIQEFGNVGDCVLEVETGLVFDESGCDDESGDVEREESGSFPESQYEPSPHPSPVKKNPISLARMRQAVEFWRSSGQKARRSLSSVQAKYLSVQSVRQLETFESTVQRHDSRLEKLAIIDNHTLMKFTTAMQNRLIVHDEDLVRWAIEANRALPNPLEFKASSTWLQKATFHSVP